MPIIALPTRDSKLLTPKVLFALKNGQFKP